MMTKKVTTKVGNVVGDNIENNLGLGNVLEDADIDGMLATHPTEDLMKGLETNMSNIKEEVLKTQEETRSQIGTIFVWGFFGFLLLGIISVVAYNITMYSLTGSTDVFLSISDVIPLVGSVVGTPLGFVMGYYFKGK